MIRRPPRSTLFPYHDALPIFQNTAVKKVSPVMGGTRSAIGKNQVKLTKSEVEMANRLGVSLQEYARQKVRQKAGG